MTEQKVNPLASYITPVTVDHAGRYPNRRPGDRWTEVHSDRVFECELVGKLSGWRGRDVDLGSTVFCHLKVQEVAQ